MRAATVIWRRMRWNNALIFFPSKTYIMYSIVVQYEWKIFFFVLPNLYIHVFFCGMSRKYLQSSILFYVKPRELSHFLILFMNDVCDDFACVQLINSVSRIVFEQGRNMLEKSIYQNDPGVGFYIFSLTKGQGVHLLLLWNRIMTKYIFFEAIRLFHVLIRWGRHIIVSTSNSTQEFPLCSWLVKHCKTYSNVFVTCSLQMNM